MSDALGRKPTILVSDVLYIAGGVVMSYAGSVAVLGVGRFIGGLGVGVTAMVVPVYLAEIVPEAYRGRVVTSYTFCIALGQCGSILVCLALGEKWRWMLGVSVVMAVGQLAGILLCPETPKWLSSKGHAAAANSVLSHIYTSSDLEALKSSPDPALPYSSLLRELLTSHLPALRIGAGLQALQQFVGINTAMYYGPSIMQKAGFDSSGAASLTAALPLFMVGVLGLSVAVAIIDRVGRRTILLWTIPPMSASLLGLSFGFYLLSQSESSFAGYICLFSLAMYVFTFALGIGPVPWLLNAEIFPVPV